MSFTNKHPIVSQANFTKCFAIQVLSSFSLVSFIFDHCLTLKSESYIWGLLC